MERAANLGVRVPLRWNTPYINTIPPEEEVAYPGDRAHGVAHQEPDALERAGDGGARQQVRRRISAATWPPTLRWRRCWKSAITISSAARIRTRRRQAGRRLRLLPGPRFARRVFPRVPRRPLEREASGKFPPRTARSPRAVVLSASLADAGLLAVPDRIDGPGTDRRRSIRRASCGIWRIAASFRRPSARSGRSWATAKRDEPESLGALTLASREKLDNLIFVVNCNLQRLDGPVRGNGSIIQELEAAFRGAGWNVIKVHLGHAAGTICSRAMPAAC